MEREGCAILNTLKIKELIRQVLTAHLNVKPWPDTDLLKIFSEYEFSKNNNETQKKRIIFKIYRYIEHNICLST